MQKTNSEKHGYKKTKFGWIPEEWKVKRMNSFGSFSKGKGISKSDIKKEGLPCILYGDLYTTHKNHIKTFSNFIDKETSEKSRQIKKGDLLFAGSGETPEEIGMCAAYLYDDVAYAGGDIIVFTPKVNNSRFLGYLMNHELVNRQKYKLAQGYSVVHLYSSHLKQIAVPLPPPPEQKKIAEILSIWDRAIETLEQLIAKKEELKKGLMQQLLTGKKRFPGFEGEWEERKLGECVIGKGDYGINAPSTSFSEDLPVYLRITDIDDRGKFSKENKTSVDDENYTDYLLEEGDIVFARTGNTTGKTYLYDNRDGELVYAGFLIRFKPDPNILLPKFLKYYTDTHRYWYWVSVMSARSGQPGINSTEYSKLTFKVPPVEEQKKIIETIDHVYSDITQLGHLKEKFQYQKKGLMQQLLTGKTRVEVQSN